ncbi:hypothetical protein BU16DRAFT_522483 [Lophium mytilinum]|uniref:Uncharacterized protein n=1 Tax=Lophium mytilinum TaxID=390894 RepID=A0A6A6RA22_9PEZI|nr:hypothetical protein BU16DRAFT_522483 [Lophium mytilinum]
MLRGLAAFSLALFLPPHQHFCLQYIPHTPLPVPYSLWRFPIEHCQLVLLLL